MIILIFSCLFFLILFNSDFTSLRIFHTQDQGTDTRLEIYKKYYEMFSNNIIFPLMDPNYNLLYAHNIFFSIYSGAGILGLIIFLYLVCFTLWASFKLIYHNTPDGWVGLIFILNLSISLVSGAILDEFFWMMLSLVNVYYIKQRKNI